MFKRGSSKERSSTRKVTPPSPSYMSNDQFAKYLADLRTNRVNRPGGARPQPQPESIRSDSKRLSGGRPSLAASVVSETSSLHQRSQSEMPSPYIRPSISASVSSRYSTMSGAGRDYYPERPSAPPLKPGEVVPSSTYIERGQRWMEKEEAYSLRQAMEDMDVKDKPEEDESLYQAALDEASELVWQHQNGVKLPKPGAPYRYKQHLRKNSYAHARTASVGRYGDDIEPSGLARDPGSRSVSGSSTSSDGLGTRRSRVSLGSGNPDSARTSLEQGRKTSSESARNKPYAGITGGPRPMAVQGSRRRSSMKRNISGEVQRPFSGDQIYEEPEGSSPARPPPVAEAAEVVQPLRIKAKNPLNRVQFASAAPPSPETPPSNISKMVSKFEIHRNPPSQSRNPQYTTNSPSERPSSREATPTKHGMEIRGDDIKEATSMKLKDRSTKLPTPSYVSDNPGRPIVSFDNNWKAPEEATDEKVDSRKSGAVGTNRVPEIRQAPSIPSITIMEDPKPAAPSSSQPSHRNRPPPVQVNSVTIPSISVSDPEPSIPSISVSEAKPPIPTICLPDGPDDGPGIPMIITPDDEPSNGPQVPAIVTPDDEQKTPAQRPLPTPGSGGARRALPRPRAHWSPAQQPIGSRATACCHECGFPIEGRFVGLAGVSARFHPQCFSCYTCGTSLEALEISPEPDVHRAARLDRIRRRAHGEVLPEEPGQTMAEDGDERLRFYCHLDWHELFAPRCKHCTTPIIGEHVVALGRHWHYGHFFCAECGDPFGPGQTHIEKDGYAWCVGCQARRTERRAPKCRACRAAVIGQYVQALGGEWHDECFRCATCGGGFDDGQVFPREGKEGRMQILCTGCRERELKA
ncbi:uncharacterized protein E0L32_003034 [Thyridium curvatum]|uniref:LIM zinc-binding domain-containing protein n=1 Tax=Thyridium curvatum TaxID=1093900 RepID=A0A507BJZ4_9PEZI|nr:uncharacterized protein E0L32_003034 [Thyridium curvatum]TPX17391.1 hypothetical protein E0L32_003034 [Thyridium curvatum]